MSQVVPRLLFEGLKSQRCDLGEVLEIHPVLEEAVRALSLDGEVPFIREAADFSERTLEGAAKALAAELPPSDELPLDVVVLGSVARREASEESDFDFLVIAHGLPANVMATRDLLKAAFQMQEKSVMEAPTPGGMFGSVISAPELTEKVGLQEDTNFNHSRRILLLEEASSIYQPHLHRDLIDAILGRYLSHYEEVKKGIPRFLLSDVLRYWHTVAVDYQAKQWARIGDEWGLRFLKLILSRKLAFAGSLASLLLCEEATVEYLRDQFAMPPLARLAQLHSHLSAEEARDLREALVIAEEFSMRLADPEFRNEVNKVTSRAESDKNPTFSEVRETGRRLQKCLERIFFDSERLGSISREYIAF
jgi:hypothetical protein